ncbi:MAG: LTA synthase family protein [Ferruginibacter sp.]
MSHQPGAAAPRFVSRLFSGRFAVLFNLLALYVLLCLGLRVGLLIWAAQNADFSILALLRAFFTGFIFDVSTGLFFSLVYAFYLLLFPKKWIGSLADKICTYTYLVLALIIIYFSLLAEIPFWDEFGSRFNFIAVDYLVYTYEVIGNINESYPLPLIFGILLLLLIGTIFLFRRRKAFLYAFTDKMQVTKRALYALPVLLLCLLSAIALTNKLADFSNNRVVNELGKNGVFSFFAAYRSNELDYAAFYPAIPDKDAYAIVKQNLLQQNQQYVSLQPDDLSRLTKGEGELRPNIVLIAIESFSADFLSAFGNTNNLTPTYDSLANHSIFFTNLYATGTRTVRGMEALTLCVPPTPGNSIVRRPGNDHLFSIATVLRQKNYHPYFIYGGDGYFDNMNNFFGGQGFDIVDRDRGNPLSENIATHRFNISSDEVSFENAWGICDEDLYRQAIRYADAETEKQQPFFQFIMTTSNHKPYTFPDGRIDLKKGNRNAAVKYTDYAIGEFIASARTKPWFSNTVFLIVADHCASSAGKWEINIDKHHIPAIIYNLPHQPEKIDRLTSQVDLLPTLFGYLGWNYTTSLYGKDINQSPAAEDRAFIGNYRTLGLLRNNIFTQIDDRKRIKQFAVSGEKDSLSELKIKNNALISQAIAFYQTASERFRNGRMKEK